MAGKVGFGLPSSFNATTFFLTVAAVAVGVLAFGWLEPKLPKG